MKYEPISLSLSYVIENKNWQKEEELKMVGSKALSSKILKPYVNGIDIYKTYNLNLDITLSNLKLKTIETKNRYYVISIKCGSGINHMYYLSTEELTTLLKKISETNFDIDCKYLKNIVENSQSILSLKYRKNPEKSIKDGKINIKTAYTLNIPGSNNYLIATEKESYSIFRLNEETENLIDEIIGKNPKYVLIEVPGRFSIRAYNIGDSYAVYSSEDGKFKEIGKLGIDDLINMVEKILIN
ncbi:MAG: hypothetical protein ACP5G1_02590 [Nanopusillaceae archaeon]